MLEKLRADGPVRRSYLLEHPTCEARVEGCTWLAVHVHHRLPTGIGGALLDLSNLVAVCRNCHEWIHQRPARARQIGLLGR